MTLTEIILTAIVFIIYGWYIRPLANRGEKIKPTHIFPIIIYLMCLPVIVIYRTVYAIIEANFKPLD
jgi:hypothetical protein